MVVKQDAMFEDEDINRKWSKLFHLISELAQPCILAKQDAMFDASTLNICENTIHLEKLH